ncbi:MAG: zinc-ribbon domain-containing protein [Muribaculaceae bacterium]|nr:zinc-ribbon domain-containing protein [Muribaculaceae bacterium]
MKFCSQCGNQIQDDAAFCASCGAPQTSEQPLRTPGQPQHQYHQPNQQNQYRQPVHRQPNYQAPQNVYKEPNPVEQAVVNFADRYCSFHSLGWSLGLCIAALVLNIFWDGVYLNFRGTLLDISESIRDYIPLWLMIDIIQLSILYLFMHLVNGLYKAGATWPLLYITPCIWIIVLILMTILALTDTGSYDDAKTLNMLQLAYYVCVGIIGILCGSIRSFSWTGKVLIIAVVCWVVSMFASNSIIPSIFFILGTLWYAFEINSRLRHFFNDYYYSENEVYDESYDETQYMQ